MPPVRVGDIKGPLLTEPLLIALAVFILGVILIPTLFVTRKMRLNINLKGHLNDYDPSYKDPTFEEKLKKAKLKPQKDIIFGTNRIAIDSLKKKLFVRSSKAIDGVLLGFEDIVSYELIKDGNVIARPGIGLLDSTTTAGEAIICSELVLIIKTKKAFDPEVVLPFISFSIDSEFVYNEALGAAVEAAKALDEIL